ncbi:MAG: universal stress protein [Cyclobacteriaceae bacterium]
MKSILIPVDFSEYAKAACVMGAHLARKTGAELFLLHVAPAPPDWNRLSVEEQQKHPAIESKIVEAEIKLEKWAKDKTLEHLKTTSIVRPGIVAEVIQNFASEYKTDIIIMGAHGLGDSKSYFIGSHAQKVLRTATCPVLSVKKDNKPHLLKKVIFAADFTEDLKKSITKLVPFAKAMGARIELLFVNTPGAFRDTISVEKAMKKWDAAFPELKMRSHIFNDYEVDRGILKFAEENEMSAIAKVTHNRKGKAGYMLGITETLLYHSTIPVISITTQ